MIESCPKKRMLLGITALGVLCAFSLTVLVLIVESHWTDSSNPSRKRIFIVEQNSTCFEKEHYEIIRECEPCTDFEIASRSIGVCIHTHYKEVLKCVGGETVTRSCDKTAYIEERLFWQFEGFMFFGAIATIFCTISRKRVLNRRVLQRMQRQLANSV